MKAVNKITAYGIMTLLACFFLVVGYASIQYEPHWHLEEQAVPSPEHPLAGFWKQQGCDEPWGWAIGPVAPGSYYVSFCGPGGCLDSGDYQASVTLVDDPRYRIIDDNTLMFLRAREWQTLVRCESRI